MLPPACRCPGDDGQARARDTRDLRQSRAECPVLGGGELAELAVLGQIHLGCGRLAEVVRESKGMAPREWQPTTDVIAAALNTAFRRGHVRAPAGRPGRTAEAWVLTAPGHVRLAELLECRLPSRGGPRVAGTAMKICFMGALDAGARIRVLGEIADAERAYLRDLRARGPVRDGSTWAWHAREEARVQGDLAWLEGIGSRVAGEDTASAG